MRGDNGILHERIISTKTKLDDEKTASPRPVRKENPGKKSRTEERQAPRRVQQSGQVRPWGTAIQDLVGGKGLLFETGEGIFKKELATY